MMTGTALLELIGGIRAAIFLALAILLGMTAGVQSLRLDHRTAERDIALAANIQWEQANRDNLQVIADLRKANKAWAGVADARKEQAAKAVKTVAAERDALAAELQKRRHDRGIIYREHPDAAAWGRTAVPDVIARQLRE